MEKIKYMFMAVLVALVSMTVTSCSDDDDDESVVNSLVNTTWTYSETNGDDDHLVITDETFTFSQSTARYTVTTIVKKGDEEVNNKTVNDYTYKYSNGIVLLYPVKANNALLEGTIERGVKMTVMNVSRNSLLGVFYKK